MNQREREIYLIDYLLKERNQVIPKKEYNFDLYRALVNVREPRAIEKEYIKIENDYLQTINQQRGIVELNNNQQIVIWQGDITKLKVDVIVNAANNQMLGCFIPGHHCIDNAIHTYAGVQLRLKCNELMKQQGYLEPTGRVKVTPAYNLPSHYIFHTVGPIVQKSLQQKHCQLLKMCYENCLKKAEEMHIESIAFCCISTGVFRFPKDIAAKIAIETVQNHLRNSQIKQVIFNVFKDDDFQLYKQFLK